MKKSIFFILLIVVSFAQAQNRKSKGDDYFFSYAYDKAIAAYEKDMGKGFALATEQKLNLADAYFMTQSYKKANELYLQLFVNNVKLGDKRINRLFRSLEQTGDVQRVKELMQHDSINLSPQLIENMEFNNDLLFDDVAQVNLDFNVFDIGGNTAKEDFSPTFYKDNLLFTSARKPLGKKMDAASAGYLDIFEGEIKEDGTLSNISGFKAIKNSKYHEATPYYSEKLNAVFYVLSNTFEGELEFDEKGKNALSIGMQRIDGDFRYLWRDLSTSFYYPYYDERTGRLYFAADFGDGYGGTDLYYVTTNNGQVMSAPVNLGHRVNTFGNEIAPYLFEGTLYFASDIFYGLGGMDIYKTEVTDNDTYSIPVNLGTQINSEKDDFGFIIKNHGEGLLGYFSSNREGGKGSDDIYGFLVDEKPGLKTFVLNGQIKNSNSGSGVAAASIALLSLDGEVLKATKADADGNYRIEVPWQEGITVEVFKDRYSTYLQKYSQVEMEGLQTAAFNPTIALYDDLVTEKEGQKVIKLRKFFFQRGSSKITPEIAVELDKAIEAVKFFPNMQLRIETHTDSRGGSATNFRITQARSDAIKKYLIANGMPASNILYSVGYGEDKILNNCTNGKFCLEMLHQQNQRSLLVILNDNILFD